MPVRHRTGPVDIVDTTDVSFPLKRLFDPYNLDHIPEADRLKLFKKRDLAHVKHYKAAVKIFGGPLSRKREIIAPPMETPFKHRLGLYYNRKNPPPPPVINSELNPPAPSEVKLQEEEIIAKQEQEKEDEYKKWMAQRQTFRHDLENMGLNEQWLRQKPKITVLERRVLNRMIKERMPKYEPPPPPPETPSTASIHDVPNVKIPSPLGIRILEQHLKKNKLRLIDLFVKTDKDKDWKITREEFRAAIKEAKVPITEALLEDLILSLDMDFDNNLDYKELAKGMDLWRKERIENRRKVLNSASSRASAKSRSSSSMSRADVKLDGPSLDDEINASLQFSDSNHLVKSPSKSVHDLDSKSSKMSAKSNFKSPRSKGDSTASKSSPTKSSTSKPSLQKSAQSDDNKENTATQPIVVEEGEVDKLVDSARKDEPYRSRSTTPQLLHPPNPDIRPDQMILSSDEAMVDLRKRDREALKANRVSPKPREESPGIIKVGDKAIDDHCLRSTMEGETAEMVDKFRQLKLREFCEIVKMCKYQGVTLSPTLLERVLLYPPDHPHSMINRDIKMPGAPLLSSHHADPPKRPRTPIEVKHKDKVRRSKSGKLLIDTRHKYPQGRSVAASGTKTNLSTGRTIIRRKVDCWMTFEEYDRLTSHLAIRYQQMHGSSDDNAFWPGHLLDKMRLCMPPYDAPLNPDTTGIVFQKIVQPKPSNLGKTRENSAWPVNDSGYVQSGMYDPYSRKYIHNP